MALPLVRAIQEKTKSDNPDIEFVIFVQTQYIPLLNQLGIEGKMVPLPKKNWKYFFHFLAWRGCLDAHVLFTNSERGDLEAWLAGARFRLGISRPGKSRKLLTHRYKLGVDFDEQALHQTNLWADFLRSFGLINGVDFLPLRVPSYVEGDLTQVGLICGSANTPEKRWAIENWQALIVDLQLKFDKVVLLGTPDDVLVCDEICAGISNKESVVNLAGKTGMSELVDVMSQQRLIIGNDTGGLHLSNVLGIPVIGLYGYTNTKRCRPIFSSPVTTIESPKGYGAGRMADITVAMVLDEIDKVSKAEGF